MSIISIEGEKVRTRHQTKHGSGSKVSLEWTFDFTDVSREALQVLATRELLIECRKSWKDADKIDKKARTINVLDHVNRAKKKGLTENEKAARNVAKMSQAQKDLYKELLA